MKKWAIAIIAFSGLLIGCTAAVTKSSSPLPSSTNPIPTTTQAPATTIPPFSSPTLTPVLLPTYTATPTTAPAASLQLERLAQLGGSINGITIVGDVAYVGKGPRVAAIDISRHEHPTLIRESDPLPGRVALLLQISPAPAPLLLVNAGKYLVLMDTSDSEQLKPLYQLELSGAISSMAWDYTSSTLYAGGSIYQAPYKYTGFISAVDLTLDHRLQVIASVDLPTWPISLALGNDSLFAALQGDAGGIYRVALNSPSELYPPDLVITPPVPLKSYQPTSLQVIGENLLVSGMTIDEYDISDPAQPMQAWSENVGIIVKAFNVSGEQIHIFGWAPAETYLPAVDTIAMPQPIKGSPIGEIASFTAMHNGDFLVAFHDLEIIDASRPPDLQLVGRYQSPVTNIIDSAINETAVFVVDYGVGDGRTYAILRVLSLPDLQPLGQVATEILTSWHQFHGITLESDRLYLSTEDGLWAYDVSHANPSLVGKPLIPGGPLETIAGISRGSQRVLIVSQNTDDLSTLSAYDLTDLQNPLQMGNPLILDRGKILQMAWDGSAIDAVLTASYQPDSEFLYVVEVNDNGLSLRQSLPIPKYVFSLAVADGLVALAGSQGLSIVSTAASNSLKIAAQVALPEVGLGVAILQRQVLVYAGNEFGAAELLAYDVQDPANPRQVGVMDIPVGDNTLVSILAAKPYPLLANGDAGLEVLDTLAYSTCLEEKANPIDVPVRQEPLEVRFISDGNIWVWEEGKTAWQLSDTGDALHFTFSPDGQVAAFERVAGDYPWGQFKIALWAINKDGSNLRQLVSADQFDSFLPGREEAWVANAPIDFRWFSGTHDLSFGVYAHINAIGASIAAQGYWMVNADTDVLKQWDHPLVIDPYGPKKIVSPDGKSIALVDRESISLQKLDGSFIRKDALTYQANNNPEGYGWGPPAVVWSPDSQTLKVVVWNVDAYYESFSAWEIPVDGTPAKKLHTFKGMEYFSSISPNQEYLAYLRLRQPLTNDRELHLAKLDGSEDVIYASGYQMNFQGWAPDSFHFAYDLFATHQPSLGSLCGSPVALVDLSQTPATQITWVDATHFLFVVGQEGQPKELKLGQVGGESLLIGPFNGLNSIYEGQWTYFQVWQPGQDVIVP